MGGVASIRFSVAASRAANSASEHDSMEVDVAIELPNISKAVEQRVFGAYFLALGEFNNAFTGVEHLLVCSIKNTLQREMKADADEWLLSAALGGMRMSPAKDTVKRLLRVQSASKEIRDCVDKAFAQLGDIQWLRDRLAHHLTLLRGTDEKHMLINLDYASAREPEKSEFIGFMPIVLRAASEDLVAIKALIDTLMCIHHGIIPGEKVEIPSWRYKPSMLVRHRPQSRGNQKLRKPPPQS